jgi:hypothetical protein
MGSFGVSAGQCTVPRQRKRVLPPNPHPSASPDRRPTASAGR